MTQPAVPSPRLSDSGGAGLVVSERPLCKCHEEPMAKDGRGGFRCAVKLRENSRAHYEANREEVLERSRERYYNLSGVEYSQLLLGIRRNKALARIREREQRGRELRSG